MKSLRLAALLFSCFGLTLVAQDTIKVNVETVQVYATVTDLKGRFVTNLKASHFKVSEDGKEQKVNAFSSDDSALSIGLLFDSGGTMGDNIEIAKESALAFLKTGNLENEYFAMEFNDKAKLAVDFTKNLSELKNYRPSLPRSRDDGAMDAMYAGVEKLGKSKIPRKILLVYTSGGHLQSEHRTAEEVRNLARKLDVQIYGMWMFEPQIHGDPSGLDSGGEVVESAGGEAFAVDAARDFLDVSRKISVGIRNQYILGYDSTNSVHDGKYRHIQVKLAIPNAPDLLIQTRDGYYALAPDGGQQ